ncbi:SOS response-associated peptidase [Halorussus sp. MSC15.2]|nr:SOS response-associated peptidase [Halorussus sp. MSC15.2]
MFRDVFAERWCLVFADGFYEWTGQRGSKQPYRITWIDDRPFAFAGLWVMWGDSADTARDTVTIITTDANKVVELIHDRMPVMSEASDGQWLSADDSSEG